MLFLITAAGDDKESLFQHRDAVLSPHLHLYLQLHLHLHHSHCCMSQGMLRRFPPKFYE